MTDAVSYSLRTDDKAHEGSLLIRCDASALNASFASDLYLGAGGPGEIELRVDEGEVHKLDAFLTNKTALLREAFHSKTWRQPIDLMMLELGAAAFFIDVGSKPHHRLRIRLRSFNGESIALDFDITGLKPRLQSLRERCESLANSAKPTSTP